MMKKYLSNLRFKTSTNGIVKSYLELLRKKNRNCISVKELCQASNISRSTFYRHYESIADVENEIIDIVLSQFNVLLSSVNLQDFIYGRKNFLNAVNKIITSDIDFYSRIILLTNQNIHFLDKANSIIQQKLKTVLKLRTSMSAEQIDLTLTFAVAGRIAVYKKWIANGFLPPADSISEMLEEISSFGFDYFLSNHVK